MKTLNKKANPERVAQIITAIRKMKKQDYKLDESRALKRELKKQ